MTITLEKLRELKALLGEASKRPWVVGISIDVEWGGWPVFRLSQMGNPNPNGEEARATAAAIEEMGNSTEELIDFAVEAWEIIRGIKSLDCIDDEWYRDLHERAAKLLGDREGD